MGYSGNVGFPSPKAPSFCTHSFLWYQSLNTSSSSPTSDFPKSKCLNRSNSPRISFFLLTGCLNLTTVEWAVCKGYLLSSDCSKGELLKALLNLSLISSNVPSKGKKSGI